MNSKKYMKVLPILGVLALVLLFLIPFQKTVDAPVGDGDIIETRAMEEFTLTSSAFEEGGTIPKKFTCDGEGINPPLSISGVPEGTQTFALIMDDPDIPEVVKTSRGIEKFDHWILFNIPITETEINSPYDGAGALGANSRGENAYAGSCPPAEHEPTEHRYIFQLYALDTDMPLREGANSEELRAVMKGHIIAKAELIGLYDRAEKE